MFAFSFPQPAAAPAAAPAAGAAPAPAAAPAAPALSFGTFNLGGAAAPASGFSGFPAAPAAPAAEPALLKEENQRIVAAEGGPGPYADDIVIDVFLRACASLRDTRREDDTKPLEELMRLAKHYRKITEVAAKPAEAAPAPALGFGLGFGAPAAAPTAQLASTVRGEQPYRFRALLEDSDVHAPGASKPPAYAHWLSDEEWASKPDPAVGGALNVVPAPILGFAGLERRLKAQDAAVAFVGRRLEEEGKRLEGVRQKLEETRTKVAALRAKQTALVHRILETGRSVEHTLSATTSAPETPGEERLSRHLADTIAHLTHTVRVQERVDGLTFAVRQRVEAGYAAAEAAAAGGGAGGGDSLGIDPETQRRLESVLQSLHTGVTSLITQVKRQDRYVQVGRKTLAGMGPGGGR